MNRSFTLGLQLYFFLFYLGKNQTEMVERARLPRAALRLGRPEKKTLQQKINHFIRARNFQIRLVLICICISAMCSVRGVYVILEGL